MSIRYKIILIIVPLFISLLVLTSSISALTAKTGLIEQAVLSFSFKSNQLEQYIVDQWQLLEDNELNNQQEYVDSFYLDLSEKADQMSSSQSEIILGFDLDSFELKFGTAQNLEYTDEELNTLLLHITQQSKDRARSGQVSIQSEENSTKNSEEVNVNTQSFVSQVEQRSWIEKSFSLGDTKFVGSYFLFPSQNLLVLVTKEYSAFYKPVREILFYTFALLIFATILSTIIIFRFSHSLVKPLKSMLHSMHNIIDSNNFDERVDILYRDEVGQLSQAFNVMITELDFAYKQIKQYAFSAVVAQKNESKIRNIFQKYVPANVINRLFHNSTSMLSGENRTLGLMFTDIRSFTTISESYTPEKLVEVLNRYFETLVNIITNMGGVIDKYIGDAIMAFFGAPVELQNSSLASISAALEMIKELDDFNSNLINNGLPQFKTGIGINYGLVTIGNIGSDKKMDYTAIGDAVNLGSRLEGLTKQYKQDLIFSNSVKQNVYDVIPCRVVDIVQVKGRSSGERIYTTTPHFTDKNLSIYDYHNQAIEYYLKRDFDKAIVLLQRAQKLSPEDFLIQMYLDRCTRYKQNPPPSSWNGVEILTSK